MILLIDNYDSFVHNLARYFQQLRLPTKVVRNNEIDIAAIREMKPEAIVLSPGPSVPERAGVSVEVVRELHHEFPLLGICLGHQAIAVGLGGRVVRSAQPMHGRTSQVFHNGTELFANVPSSFEACRYHSLVVQPESLPTDLEVIGTCEDETIMAIQHRIYPVVGLQFHPEAILTDCGYRLLSNFLQIAGIPHSCQAEQLQDTEKEEARSTDPIVPSEPVTF